MQPTDLVIQPYTEAGVPRIGFDFSLGSRKELETLLQFLQNPHMVVKLIMSYGVEECILQPKTIDIRDLVVQSSRAFLEPL